MIDVQAVMKKLQYKGQSPVLVMNAPVEMAPVVDGFAALTAEVHASPSATYSFAIAFAQSLADANAIASAVPHVLEGDALFWFAYPKQSSKRYKADVNRDSTWPIFEPTGWRPVAQVAIDDDWSAVRLRRADLVKK